MFIFHSIDLPPLKDTPHPQFNIDDALDKENLEIGAVRRKAEFENDEEAGEPSAKAVKTDNA